MFMINYVYNEHDYSTNDTCNCSDKILILILTSKFLNNEKTGPNYFCFF